MVPTSDSAAADDFSVAIVGSGFAGLGIAIRLKQAGFHNFTIYEQSAGIGGTWRANTYPGAACDVMSHLYSFSFEPNPRWSRTYAAQDEILHYIEHCAEKYELRPHLRLNTAIEHAAFDDVEGVWQLRTASGEQLRANVLVSGCGGLSRPGYPDIPGVESFGGRMFHTARWDHNFELEGKTVGVIGTGASAIQVVPAIAAEVGQLRLYQRTPPWIIPRDDHAISETKQRWYTNHPWLQQVVRGIIYWRLEVRVIAFTLLPFLMKAFQWFARRFIDDSVADPQLRAAVTPDYTIGCKRILLSNDYYPALQRDNVELITCPIECITQRGIRTSDGREQPLDAIVFATGFQAAEAAAPFDVVGLGGRSLEECWVDGAEAYKGTTVAGFPNLFMLVGPNTGLGHSSMIFIIESQIQYTLDAIQVLREQRLRYLDVNLDAQSRYNLKLHERLSRTVWASGCNSWYQTRSGKNTTLWPGFTWEYRLRTRRFDAQNYQLVAKS